MGWSFPLGRVFGIPIRIHFTFFLLLLFLYISHAGQGHEVALFTVLVTCLIFACVLAHELGHCLAAFAFGIRTRAIILLPIGGVALLEQIPREPGREIVISLAGPTVSVLLSASFFVWGQVIGCDLFQLKASLSLCHIIGYLFWINAILVLFNLLPAFPMDGGRVFRGLLTLLLGWERGTRFAVGLGQLLAVGFMVMGLLFEGFGLLLLVGLFIFFGATEEGRLVRTRIALEGIRARNAMLRSFAVLRPQNSLYDALVRLVTYNQNDLPVVENGFFVGMLSLRSIFDGIRRYGLHTPVEQVLEGRWPVADPDQDLTELHHLMLRRDRQTFPVVRDGRLLGLLSWDQLNRFAFLRRQLRRALELS